MTKPTLCHSDGCRHLTRYPSRHCPSHQEPNVRLQPTTIDPRVTRNPKARRQILLTIAGHAYALSPNEARDLADSLVDATEDAGACPKSDDRPDS
ncbi:hypothetical protein [Prescottella agglutinans]|uniref:hypothetical protein n=1 Tax=Prescottella agglutinans TaxID=1644129 RepID=UPI003D9920A8